MGRTGHSRSGVVALAVLLVTVLLGCSPASDGARAGNPGTTASTSTSLITTTSTSSTTTTAPPAPSPPDPVPAPTVRDRLAVLVVDDRPSPVGDYRREDWPHWSDVDGNGCDARQDALVIWSVEPATVNRSGGCRVVVGWWISPYDGRAANNPSDFDVDHLVPLENAFESGGWRWTAGQRRAFANDQRGLVVTSASSNRSKGSRTPDEWRPADRSSWCAFALGWVDVKQEWALTVTTSERDALGQMLDTCSILSPMWPERR